MRNAVGLQRPPPVADVGTRNAAELQAPPQGAAAMRYTHTPTKPVIPAGKPIQRTGLPVPVPISSSSFLPPAIIDQTDPDPRAKIGRHRACAPPSRSSSTARVPVIRLGRWAERMLYATMARDPRPARRRQANPPSGAKRRARRRGRRCGVLVRVPLRRRSQEASHA